MDKFKNIPKAIKREFSDTRKIDVILWAAVILGTATVGFLITFFSFREGIDFGDGSTFFSFAHNLYSGEAIYKDFIHFRTPGSYFLQSAFLHILGDQQSSVRFALSFESLVLYPIIFFTAVAVFLRFKKIYIGIILSPLIIMLPAFAQLRTAFAFLAVALYAQALRSKRSTPWLIATGVIAGVSFMFGQEAAVIAIATIGAIELVRGVGTDSVKQILKRIGYLILGFFIGVLPLLVYVLAVSDLGNFLYYTIYYAFVLQPQGMDLIYPKFSYSNLIFYLIFAMYTLCFYIIYASKIKSWTALVLLGFVIVRSVTLLGRSDMPHLIFILPETIFLICYCLFRCRQTVFTKDTLIKFIPYAIAMGLAFYMAIHFSSSYALLALLIAAVAYKKKRPSIPKRVKNVPTGQLFIVFFLLSAGVTILLYLIYPYYRSVYENMSKVGVTGMSIEGVNVDMKTLKQVNEVKAAVAAEKPDVIFAYPIQAFYYDLAPHHAARFMTFEPQTTTAEQLETIADLQKTRPEVIIYDPIQAEALKKPLEKINRYILKNYEIKTVVNESRELWVMVPRQ